MRVLVTGATGFVGAHSAKALVDAGHSVRALVRDPARLLPSVGTLGVDIDDYVTGDMTDADAVRRAIDGCDAVLHCAAVVSLKRERADEVRTANPRGAQIVMDEALQRGLDPIVIVSSASALAPRPGEVLRVDDPPHAGGSPYEQSKAETVRVARRYQSDGAPITLTLPGGVIGPAIAGASGETGAAVVAHMQLGLLPVPTASIPFVDVRDVALIHAAVMTPGRGPRSYLCGGHTVTMNELAEVYRDLTGRRFPVLPIPGAAMRFAGRAMDTIARVAPVDSVITEESMVHFTRWVGSDDERIGTDLGVQLRPLAATLADTIRDLHAAGLVAARQVGRLAAGS